MIGCISLQVLNVNIKSTQWLDRCYAVNTFLFLIVLFYLLIVVLFIDFIIFFSIAWWSSCCNAYWLWLWLWLWVWRLQTTALIVLIFMSSFLLIILSNSENWKHIWIGIKHSAVEASKIIRYVPSNWHCHGNSKSFKSFP